MTFDNGGEFARHTPLRSLLAYGTYFCDAYASWQKGKVENTNGRLRRCLPRGIDLDDLDDQDCQDIALTLNTSPRKCLAYRTPTKAFLTELGKTSQSALLEPGVASHPGIHRPLSGWYVVVGQHPTPPEDGIAVTKPA